MHKKSKTIVTAVVTALFALSLSYFALLAPTTAWYYQKEDKSLSFTFASFGMNAPTPQSGQTQTNIRLRGATRFADAGETLFDQMVYILRVNATNAASSAISGSVSVRVKQGNTEWDVTDGTCKLKWFVYEYDTVNNNTSAKTEIGNMLTAADSTWPLNYRTGDFSSYTTGSDREAKYEAYNAQALETLKAHNDAGISVLPGDTKQINIAFWAEYGAVKGDFEVDESPADRDTTIPTLEFNDLTIEVVAKPDTGGTQTQTLTITSTASAATSVTLYKANSSGVFATTGTTVSVPENDSATIPNLPVGLRYKLVLDGQNVHFGNSDPAVETDETGTVLTGTISNTAAGNAITVEPAPATLLISNTVTSAGKDLKLYQWTSGAWVVYTGSYTSVTSAGVSTSASASGETITVPAGGSAQISLAADTQYKVVLQSASVHFNNSGNATQIIGKMTNGSASASIVAD